METFLSLQGDLTNKQSNIFNSNNYYSFEILRKLLIHIMKKFSYTIVVTNIELAIV